MHNLAGVNLVWSKIDKSHDEDEDWRLLNYETLM